MRVVRIQHNNQVFYGTIEGDVVRPLSKDSGITTPVPVTEAMVVAPVTPTKIICLGFNYLDHAEEFEQNAPEVPLLFYKPPSAIIGPGQAIVLPEQSERVEHEGELAVVLGRMCRNVEPDEVAPHIFGYTCANDVTARDLQASDGLFGRAKGFDTFAPIGPWIETEVADPANLTLRTTINGQVQQQTHTSKMLFKPFEIVSYVSKIMTLMPGDVILTGTPSGSSAIAPGDDVRVEIENVGVLVNAVVGPDGGTGLQNSSPPAPGSDGQKPLQ